MGVRGLKSFLSRNVATQTIRIQQMAEEFRQKNPGAPVCIAVDGRNCCEQMYDEDSDCNCGGQYMEMVAGIENFVNAFVRLRIKLVFFYTGAVNFVDNATWWGRRKQDIDEINAIFLQYKTRNTAEATKWFGMSTLQQLAIRAIYKHHEYVEVYQTVVDDVHLTVAEYSKENNCLAILANDTAYVVYDTVPLLSGADLNFSTMTTTIIRPKTLCRSIGLQMSEMPIMAAIIGNSIVSFDELSNFHDYLCQRHRPIRRGLIAAAIKFIQDCRLKGPVWEAISKDIVRFNISADRLQRSIDSYRFGNNDLSYYSQETIDDIYFMDAVEYFKKQTIQTNIRAFIMKATVCGRMDFTMALQDSADPTLIPAVLLFRPVRQKLYGIIFASPEIETRDIKELWISYNKQHRIDDVTPIPLTIDGENKSLTELWRSRAEDSNENRSSVMDVLLSCFDLLTPLNLQRLLQIPEHLRALCVITSYMCNHPEMKVAEWERAAFAVQAIVPNANDAEHWKNVKFNRLEPRAVDLAAIFTKGIRIYMDALSVCGLNYDLAMPWKYFDGKRFQLCYQEIKNDGKDPAQLCDETNTELFNQMMQFINGHD